MQGRPVRAATQAGDRVFLLTGQWKSYRPFRGTSATYTELLVDVWAFDGATGVPASRTRLEAQRGGTNAGRALLGADRGALWVLTASGLLALSPKDGSVVADVAKIEAANPPLKGLLPKEEGFFRFDATGLAFRAADGRSWRLDGATLAARPDEPSTDNVAFPPARISGGVGTYMFQERGLDVGRRWLGLLAESEVAPFRSGGAIGGMNPAAVPRTRLWSARTGSRETFFGPRPTYEEFAPLPDSPEFLNAGLLSDGNLQDRPVLVGNDSLLVLHVDRLGDEGRLQLSRLVGPSGREAWRVALPMRRLDAVMPGTTSVALLGSRPEPDPMRPQDNRTTAVDQLAVIDLGSGRMAVYGFLVRATAPEVIPPSSTR